MSDARNRGDSKRATNDWLTPPELLAACGPFDLDPACYPVMPWKTAEFMYALDEPAKPNTRGVPTIRGNGLDAIHWAPGRRLTGQGLILAPKRVWCNPPWNNPLPWVERMAQHAAAGGRGLMLTSAKSLDTRWGQLLLRTGDGFLFFAGRLRYHYPDGAKSEGAWTPSVLTAYGVEEVALLRNLVKSFPGVVLT